MAKTAHRRDSRSAFFSRLPFRAKSAMAEILVSDQYERCLPLLIGGFFCCREERGPCCIVFGSFRPVFLACFFLFFSLFLLFRVDCFFCSRLQGLMLYFCRFSPCKSPVFLKLVGLECTPKVRHDNKGQFNRACFSPKFNRETPRPIWTARLPAPLRSPPAPC